MSEVVFISSPSTPREGRLLVIASDLFVGVVFFVAAASKLYDSPPTVLFVERLIPASSGVSRGVVYGVIVVEIVLGFMLVGGISLSLARQLSLLLLIALTAALVWASLAGVSTSCGCLRIPFMQESLVTSLLRNAMLLTVTSIAVFVSSSKEKVL